VSEKKSPFIFVITYQMSSNFSTWQKHTSGNWKHTYIYIYTAHLVKTSNNFAAYSIVSTASDMKSPYKSLVVTSDNCQVTLGVTRKRDVHIINIIKANVQIVVINTHTSAQPSMLLVSCLVGDMLWQSDHATVRRHLRSATSSMGLQ